MKDEDVPLIRKIESAIYEVVGYKVRGSSKDVEEYRKGLRAKKTLARGIFYKYGLERKIAAYKLTRYTNDSTQYNAQRISRIFTKHLAKNLESKDLYERFLLYINELETVCKEGKVENIQSPL